MRKWYYFLFLSLILFYTPDLKALNNQDYLDYVAKADSLGKEENWIEAELMLRKALRSEPANPGNQMLLANMGMILTAQGKYGDAIQHLDAALIMNPGSFLAYKNRGITYSAMKMMDEALDDFSHALSIDSLDNDVRCMRATVYCFTKDFEKAMSDYLLVLEKDRSNASALEGMANCCLAKGRHDNAIPYLNRLIEVKPEPEHYFTRGLTFSNLGRFTEASEDVSTGLLLDPGNGNLWLVKAYIEKTTYRYNEAKTSLQKARKYGCDYELENQLLPDM